LARLKETFPGLAVDRDPSDAPLYTVLSMYLPEDASSHMLIYNLDIEGIDSSGGSASIRWSNKGSHVIGHLCPVAKERTCGSPSASSYSRRMLTALWRGWPRCALR